VTDEHEKVAHAVNMLDQACQQLTGPRMEWIEGKLHTRPSRYQEIRDDIAGQQGAQNRAHARSMPPIWIDAADWLKGVDKTIRGWIEGENTPHRLAVLVEHHWRPQDLDVITLHTKALLDWVSTADELINPTRRWTVAAACPECGVSTVYRRDNAGESVRTPALSLTAKRLECLSCRTYWGNELFEFVAGVIGCAKPVGVVEGLGA
jgi:hypothetical protein